MEKSISKNAFFKAILNICNIILPIIVTPLVLGAIKERLNGYVAVGETWTGVFIVFASFGVSKFGLREVARVRDDKKKLTQTISSLFVITTTTSILVSIAYFAFVILFHSKDPYFYTCMVMGLNIVNNIFYVEWINESLENYDFIAKKTMCVKIVYSILIICVVRSEENYLFYLYLTVIINFINNVWSFIYIKKSVKFDFSNLQIMRYLKPMFTVLILSNTYILYTQLDKWMIESHIGSTETGYYATAQKVMTMINTLILTIIDVSTARLSNYLVNYSKETYMALLDKIIKICLLLLFPAAVGLFCVSRQVMIIFARGTLILLPAVPIMMVFSIYMLTAGIDRIIVDQMIYVFGKEKEDTKIVFIGGVINLILNTALVLSGNFTPAAAVMTTLLANVFVIGVEYFKIVKSDIKLEVNMFCFDNLKYLLYSLLFLPVAFIINKYVESVMLSCAAIVILCCLLYGSILFITHDKIFFELLKMAFEKIKHSKKLDTL